MKFYPYEKGGGGRSLRHAEGGGGGAQKVFRYFLCGSLKF